MVGMGAGGNGFRALCGLKYIIPKKTTSPRIARTTRIDKPFQILSDLLGFV